MFKRPVLCWLLLLSCAIGVNGQTFSLTSRLDHLNAQYNSMVLDSGKIFCIGMIQDTVSPYLAFNVFACYDTSGHLNYYKVFKGDSSTQEVGTFENSLIRTRDGGFAVCGYTLSNGRINCLFIKYDYQGNVVAWKQYKRYLNSFFGRNIVQSENGGFYLTGLAQRFTGDIDIFVMKLDSVGGEVWYKTYGEPTWHEYANSLILTRDSNVLIMGSKSDDNTSPPYAYSFRKVLLLDVSGNVLLDSIGNDENVSATFDIASTADGGFVFCGSYTDVRVGNEEEVGYIEKVDSNLHSVWRKKLGTAAPQSMTFLNAVKEFANGDILASGYSFNNTLPYSQQHQNGWIVRLSAAGAWLWSREYRGVTRIGQDMEENKLFDFGILDDGGIVACGKAQDDNDTFPQKAWLLRLNENGCLNDSFCGYGYTGVEEITKGLNDFEVYPNPFNRIVNLKIKGEAVTLSITNSMGQVVYARPFSTTTDEVISVDLESLSSGLYFLAVSTARDKVVRRLVKE